MNEEDLENEISRICIEGEGFSHVSNEIVAKISLNLTSGNTSKIYIFGKLN